MMHTELYMAFKQIFRHAHLTMSPCKTLTSSSNLRTFLAQKSGRVVNVKTKHYYSGSHYSLCKLVGYSHQPFTLAWRLQAAWFYVWPFLHCFH